MEGWFNSRKARMSCGRKEGRKDGREEGREAVRKALFVFLQHVQDFKDGGMVQLTQGTDVLRERGREGGDEGGRGENH